ncbi:MAG TPA: hypothetical protein VMX13_13920 [Sedimentisphaerales bacterium]|nr:hypothetical protein [Sedimentisphaerales bacterium]
MKRIVICVLIISLGLVSAGAGKAPTKGGDAAARPVELALGPAGVPEPNDKYQFLPQGGEQSDCNAVSLYEDAVKALPKNAKDITRWRKIPPSELPIREVQVELKRFEPSLKLVEQAARCKTCQWPAVQLGAMPANHSEFRVIAQALALQARLDIAQKKYDSAIHTVQTGVGMARHIAEGPTLIHGLVGVAVGTLALNEAEYLIQAPDSPNLYCALQALPRPLIDLTGQMDAEIANIKSQYLNPLARIAMKRQLEPAHDRARVLTKKLDRQAAALQLIEALRLHASAHDGKFPHQLSDVTTVSVPADPLSGKPFVYRRSGGKAVLEAVLPETATPKDTLKYNLTLKE